MKNINSFIKSHCGFGGISSVSRRYFVLLTALLSLGVGNAWGAWYVSGDGNSWGTTEMTQSTANSNIYYYKVSGAWTFKVRPNTNNWNNAKGGSNIASGHIISLSSVNDGNGGQNISGGSSGETWYICYNSSTDKVFGVFSMNIAGDDWLSPSTWSTSAYEMTYDGASTFTWTSSSSVSATAHKLKITRCNTNNNWNNAVGYSSNVSCVNGSVADDGTNDHNSSFKPSHAGTVTITYNWSTGKVFIYCPYQVSYAAGTGASGSVSASAVTTYGSTCTLSTSTFTKTGYTQDGWSTSNGGNKVYNLGATYTGGYTDVTLYPHWNPNTYTITLNGNSGTGHTESVTATYNSSTLTSITNPTRDGYTFAGWYTNSDGTGTMLIDVAGHLTPSIDSYTDAYGKWIATTGTNLYARWKTNASVAAYNFQFGSGTYYSSSWTLLNFGEADNHVRTVDWTLIDPTDKKFYVGFGGDFWTAGINGSSYGISEEKNLSELRLAPGNLTVGTATGAVGKLVINDDSSEKNLYVGFQPNGYGLTYNSGTKAFSKVDDYMWQTDIVTLAAADVSGTFKVGLATATSGTYVDCSTMTATDNAAALNTRKNALVSEQSYPTIPDLAAGQEGRFVIWDNDTHEGQQWYLSFLPVYSITYNANGADRGTVPTDANKYRTNETPSVLGNTGTLEKAGYAFSGWNTEADGNGTAYAAGVNLANIGSDVTLYAQFQKSEITNIALNATVFDPVAAGETGWVIANPTLDPAPAPTTIICWELQYDNGSPVPERDPEKHTEGDTKPNQVRFSIAGLAAGSYKIKATLRAGSTCDATSLSEREVSFSIASGFTVTIQYKDAEGNTIATSTTTPGKATDWTSVTAPNIVGYDFSTWVLGDGITKHESDALTLRENFRFETTFNGTLTAQYTKKGIIYFKNTLGWSNVWVNFMSGDYWNTSNGSGNSNKYHSRNNQMTLMPGTTDVYYFEYSGTTTAYISFTSASQEDAANFWASGDGINVVFPTRFDASNTDRAGEGFGYNAGTPMFVPLSGQSGVEKNINNDGKANYYNKGHWVDYNPISHNTGYTLEIYNHANADGSREVLKTVKFYENGEGALEATVDLEAATTYAVKFLRDNNMHYTNVGSSNLTDGASMKFEYNADNYAARTFVSTAAGGYVFKIRCNSDGYLYLTATFPAAANDFQILYNDRATWSLGSAHDENWVHPSRIIRAREGGEDIISFFVAKDNTPILKARKVNSINEETGAITWGSLNINEATSKSLTVDSSAVYNFKVTQGAAGTIASIEYIGPYTGNYYIRCNALNSNWDNYITDGDHMMTYSSFSESAANSFGEKYSHYKAKWCPRNTNIAFCIANDYSPCITDTLKQDVNNPYSNTDAEGTLNNDGDNNHSGSQAYLDRYSANVRFMWNRKTNKISRAYVSAATSGRAKFLVLQGNEELKNEAGSASVSDEGITNGVLFSDKENWIYERTLQIKPGTLFKVYACYANESPTEANAQYFRGNYADDTWDAANTVVLIGGSGSYQKARIVYDFKTNRLIAAWMPSGSNIDGDIDINADVMVVREHHESAQCITFADDNAKLSDVKTVYGVMRFNRWILNNRQNPEDQDKNHARPDHIADDLRDYHAPLSVDQQKSNYERRLYFISFPFDVRVGDIFGFGQYGQYWVIQYYDGLNRAKNGYWSDSKPNWKYVSPSMVSQGYTLEANQGYILELNLNAMAADNTTFWSNGISTIELYFPSTVAQETLKQTNCTIPALSADYECKINRGTGTDGDRRVKDSYWRCIGVPSYNLYNSTLTDGSGNEIRWNTDYTWQSDDRAFPFIYVWNKTDNTLTPQSTSNFTFQPMHAYLTQIKSAIVWTAVSAKEVSPIVARRARKEADNEHEWRIELKQDSTFLDQTYVRMTNMEQVTDSFDFGQDMIKELNSRSNIYTYIGYEKVAANSMTVHSDQTTVIPVGLNIRADGEYTFAMPDGTSGVGVTLIDNVENTRTNLSALDYTVTLSAGEYTNRFFLEISPVQNTPTDIEAVSGQPSEVRKVMIDGILYIVKDGKMYDARGTLVHGSAR